MFDHDGEPGDVYAYEYTHPFYDQDERETNAGVYRCFIHSFPRGSQFDYQRNLKKPSTYVPELRNERSGYPPRHILRRKFQSDERAACINVWSSVLYRLMEAVTDSCVSQSEGA